MQETFGTSPKDVGETDARSMPAGGFRLISTNLIVAIWFGFREGLVSLHAVRCFFALHEISARRYACACSERRAGRRPTFKPRLCVKELAKLLGLPTSKAKAALLELHEAGLVATTEHSIRFTSVSALPWSDDRCLDFEVFLQNFRNANRRVPIPRRTLVLIAESSSKALIWSMLACCLRCVFYYSPSKDYRCVGCAKASWIAKTGGFSLRAAKGARQFLVERGWLKPLHANQFIRNRYGERFEVSPQFWRERLRGTDVDSFSNVGVEISTTPTVESIASPPVPEKCVVQLLHPQGHTRNLSKEI